MRSAIRWASGALWLLGAWAIPVAAQRFHVMWLVPLLVLGLTAGLLRTGRTLLDRLVPAMALLCAVAAIGFALPIVWLTTAALAVLGLVHIVTGRWPLWPRPSLVDTAPIAGSLLLTGIFAVRELTADQANRIALWMIGEEGAQHFSLFEAMRFGSAANAHMERTARGWHVTAALLDRLFFGLDASRPALASLDHYLLFAFAGFALLILTVLWAVVALAGRGESLVRQAFLVAFALLFVVTGDLPGTLVFGYPDEALALALLAVLVVQLARDGVGTRERVVIAATVLIGLSFVYPFLLAAGLAGTLVWIWRNRSELLRHKVFAVLLGLGALTAVVFAVVLGQRGGAAVWHLSLGTVGAARIAWVSNMIGIGIL